MTTNTMINKLNNLIKKVFGVSDSFTTVQVQTHVSDNNVPLDMRQKEMDVYGMDRITQQKLYEKWAVKQCWHLRNQAIPLLLAMDPENYTESLHDETSKQRYEDLWLHAQHCVEQGLLPVSNLEAAATDWQAAPVDVYKWAAISRVQLPEQLTFLMEFILKSILSTENNQDIVANSEQNSRVYDKDKENILGAALAILVAYPERCRNNKGRVKSENILTLVNENEGLLFGDDLPELSPTASLDIINKWLNKISLTNDRESKI